MKFLNIHKNISVILFLLVLTSMPFVSVTGQTKAFPTAEGYGQFTTGGRGGVVYEVTNLNDSGPGSLREGVDASGARTIVFRVSGTIHLKSDLRIRNNNITIAGQTAPGDGICIADYQTRISADNIIFRYLRFRLGDIYKQEVDAIWGREQSNIILDHCSMSWSIDESASFYDNADFTMQWCIISESLNDSFHSKGTHGYGGIWGGMGATFHHNLIAHHTNRNPRFNGSRYSGDQANEIVDFVNNVVYNWGYNNAYGGEGGNQNIRKNYYKYGPATSESKRNRIIEPSDTAGNWYVADNFVYDYPDITADNWNGGVQGSRADYQKSKNITSPFPISEVETQSAEEVFDVVLDHVGASFPNRDSVDTRIVNETINGTAEFGNKYEGGGNGIIDSQEDVGGWPVLNSLPAPVDSDHDGMPDVWEEANNLNPNDDSDRNILNEDGYTMLEVYINNIEEIIPTSVDSEIGNITPEFTLNQNYPNPFNPSTEISYVIPESGMVSLFIYDALGRRIDELVHEHQSAGYYNVNWNPSLSKGYFNSSGIYFAKLTAGKYSKLIKMIYLK